MAIKLPLHKTKIVCTIGPASRSKKVLRSLISSGMNVARLNFSHGDLEQHMRDIQTIRSIARGLDRVVAILADLPGPKIRIGKLEGGSVMLQRDDKVMLTTRDITGSTEQIPIQYKEIIQVISKGSMIYLNDGFIQLRVLGVKEDDIFCRVIIGGQLFSNKGINLPDARLTVKPVTKRDLDFVDFGLRQGVDAFSVSFAQDAGDILMVKEFIASRGGSAHVVAKIERKEALENIDKILDASDGIMIARGDLGVELPIEKVPTIQKGLIHKANLAACPVITATQMLESMTENIRPTRAEATDVANAILDGTDAVMLSEETAIGRYPVDAVKMLTRIARVTEAKRGSIVSGSSVRESITRRIARKGALSEDILSLDITQAMNTLNIRYVLAPTLTGGTARRISRYKDDTWILAFCTDEKTRNFLTLSYGVYSILKRNFDSDEEIVSLIRDQGLLKPGDKVIVARRLPHEKLGKTNSFKIITLG